MSEMTVTMAAGRPQLDYLPIGLFGSVLGLTGLSVSWRLAYLRYGFPEWFSTAIGALAATAFVAMVVAYGVKVVTAFPAVSAEFHHPITANLFAAFLISLLVLPAVITPYSLLVARVMWVAGTVSMLGFAWLIISRWMSDRQQIAHATPVWIIPVVGLLDVTFALPMLNLPSFQFMMMYCLAIGLFFAVPLFTVIFSRLLFEAPLPTGLQPSLLILVAPFAEGYSAYTLTTGRTDLFADALYALMVFVLAVLLGRLRHLPVCCPFRVSWWGVSFPLAASTAAALRHASASPNWMTDGVALALLALVTSVIAALLVRTLMGLAKGELRALST